MGVWDGLPPAIWTPYQLWKSPQSATASATNSVSLARRFGMAGRLKSQTNGCAWDDPWELPRPESTVEVNFGGHTEAYTDDQGQYRVRWIPAQVVNGVPCDMTILGYNVNTANTLRLWKAEARESFSLQEINVGDYYGAVHDREW